MFSKFSFIITFLAFSVFSFASRPSSDSLNDETVRHILKTLPKMVPQLRDAGINVSQADYIWPRNAALHAKGEKILEAYGYDALMLNALETFCKAWFCYNYDSLDAKRKKILTTTEEQITENPYITDEQKRINIRILKKELGHSKEQLREIVGKTNLRMVRIYCEKTKEVWQELE